MRNIDKENVNILGLMKALLLRTFVYIRICDDSFPMSIGHFCFCFVGL